MQFEEPSQEHLKVLGQYFGHQEFKKEQWRIIRALMYEKRDCCVIASTGFGKSLIYQFPGVFLDKLVVVFSPLIALMQDQVYYLQSRGIKACYFGSQQTDKTLRMEDHNIIYITPEFYSGQGKRLLSQIRQQILLFAIDEAHVLEQWGNDFRPAYRCLSELRGDYPNIPIIALTATAPQYLEDMIVSSLKLRNFHHTKTALDRPNLEFIIQPKRGYMLQVLPLLKELTDGSAIVYCLSQALTEEISEAFNRKGIQCKPYHAGKNLNPEYRKNVVKDFRSNSLRIVICTIAFGMGIDKPDVRLVIHYGISKSLEAYYQEAGRAGRDGKPSKCVMFYCEDDFSILRGLMAKNTKMTKEQRDQQNVLIARVHAFTKSSQCRRIELLNYLGTTKEELAKLTIRENCCNNCQRDLFYKVPLRLRYHDVTDDGKYDFSEETRILLKAVNRNLIPKQIVDLLHGILPTKAIYRSYNLSSLGTGRKKEQPFWVALISLLTQNLYAGFRRGNCLNLEYIAQKFLRNKGAKLLLKPTGSILGFLRKREDIELYWDNNEIKSRRKSIASQGRTLQNNVIDEVSTQVDDNDFDAALVQAAETIEAEDRVELPVQRDLMKVIESLQQENRELKDKLEIENLKNISCEFDNDEDEEWLADKLSKKRQNDDGEDNGSKRLKE